MTDNWLAARGLQKSKARTAAELEKERNQKLLQTVASVLGTIASIAIML